MTPCVVYDAKCKLIKYTEMHVLRAKVDYECDKN